MKTFLLFAIVLLSSSCTTLREPVFADDEGAIRGYDPVAYFLQSEPVKGDRNIALNHDGATWYFSSDDNRQRFRDNPAKYKPHYGGYCAYAMSKGLVVSIDPQAWHVNDDGLYLNYSPGVRNTWLKDVPGYVEKADRKWQEKIRSGDR